jgi:FtsZ-interacting cell division protein ZipA
VNVSSTSASKSEKKRPIVWMIVAGVAILAAIGLGIWAFKANSDLNETQADLDAQKAATLQAQAKVQAQTEAANAAAADLEKISSDNEIYVVSNEDVAQAQSDVAAAEQAVAEASANVSAAQDQVARLSAEREQARAERDLARAERQQSRICSRGSLGVLSKLGKGEADAASSELETVSSACAATVSG